MVSQFRCNGSDGYLAWLDYVLQIRDTANLTLDNIDYDFVVEDDPGATAVTGVYLIRSDGVLSLERPSTDDGIAVLNVPGQSPQTMSVPARTIEECLSEELGRLDPDEIYAEVVTQGWDLINSKH